MRGRVNHYAGGSIPLNLGRYLTNDKRDNVETRHFCRAVLTPILLSSLQFLETAGSNPTNKVRSCECSEPRSEPFVGRAGPGALVRP